jgi:hypothetical protein
VFCAFATEVPRLMATINDIPYGPDHGPTYDLSLIIRSVDTLRAELRDISCNNPQLGIQAAEYASGHLQVERACSRERKTFPDKVTETAIPVINSHRRLPRNFAKSRSGVNGPRPS